MLTFICYRECPRRGEKVQVPEQLNPTCESCRGLLAGPIHPDANAAELVHDHEWFVRKQQEARERARKRSLKVEVGA